MMGRKTRAPWEEEGDCEEREKVTGKDGDYVTLHDD